MIELYTGLPKNGKTLAVVDRLNRLIKKIEADSSFGRSIYANINGLTLPHQPIPLKSVQLTKNAAPVLVPDWDEMADGALVISDESQGFFPPRSSVSTVPVHVAWLNTHGHRGFDIILITQHPKLIDGSVRALVGRHIHYRRLWGQNRSVTYEWDSSNDSLSGFGSAIKGYYAYPKELFKLYKSASEHTKQSFKLPLWVYIPFIGFALSLYFVPKAYSVMTQGVHKDAPVTQDVPAKASNPSLIPSIPMPQPQTSVQVMQSQIEPLMISACMSTASRCQCYDHRGIKIDLSEPECRASSLAPSQKFRFEEPRYAPQQLASK